jgi:hypothetical protein
MNVTYRLEVGTGSGDAGYCLMRVGQIPFVPHAGMSLIAVDGDDYREVDAVYWSELEGLQVYLVFDEKARRRPLLKLGWVEE